MVFSDQISAYNFACISYFFHACYTPAYLIGFHFIVVVKFDKLYNIWSFSLFNLIIPLLTDLWLNYINILLITSAVKTEAIYSLETWYVLRCPHDFTTQKINPNVSNKPLPCREMLWHAKNSIRAWNKYFVEKNHYFIRPDPSDLLLDGFTGRIARERSNGRIGSFPLLISSTMVLHAHISLGGWTIGPLVATVQRRNLTP
jgi:hypothetical protein